MVPEPTERSIIPSVWGLERPMGRAIPRTLVAPQAP